MSPGIVIDVVPVVVPFATSQNGNLTVTKLPILIISQLYVVVILLEVGDANKVIVPALGVGVTPGVVNSLKVAPVAPVIPIDP